MDILLGLQWGDEGKGKIVDFLAPHYDVVARFQGGPNAGHTLYFDDKKHVLHQIPSGIFRTHIKNIIGNGVVLDLITLRKEIEALIAREVEVSQNLFISQKAHIILPTHRLLDAASELAKGENKIGSTLRGISPTYQEKIGRSGIRIGDVFAPNFDERYQHIRQKHLRILDQHQFDYSALPQMEAEFFEALAFIKTYKMVDAAYLLNAEISQQKKILAEGAQGTLLDIDFGSYPFVTSSNTTAAGACTGLGVAPTKVKEVFGIFKAYCTRVGSGPFPTELHDEVGERIRKEGAEFGATTGRPRRCGWLDLPALRYSIMLNGVTQLFMMKTDVLTGFEEIEVCTAYRLADGSITQEVPYDPVHTVVKPVYQSMKGWGNFSESVNEFEELPQELQNYVAFIEEAVGVPINLISYGADRKHTLMRKALVK